MALFPQINAKVSAILFFQGEIRMRNSRKVKLLQRFEFINIDVAVVFYVVKDQSYFNIGLLI